MINFERYQEQILDYIKNNTDSFDVDDFKILFDIKNIYDKGYESNFLNILIWGFTESGPIPNTHDDFKRRLVEAGRLISETCRQHDSCYTCPLRDPGKKKNCAFEAPPEYILFDIREEPWSAVVPTEEDDEDES